jgi:hypothetical protein
VLSELEVVLVATLQPLLHDKSTAQRVYVILTLKFINHDNISKSANKGHVTPILGEM